MYDFLYPHTSNVGYEGGGTVGEAPLWETKHCEGSDQLCAPQVHPPPSKGTYICNLIVAQ